MKTTKKKTTCPFCNAGNLKDTKQDYIAQLGDGQSLRIPNIEMEACDKCGEQILSLEAAQEVDSAIADYTDRPSPSEIKDIREFFDVGQTEMGEALGLGAKTLNRWENGSQYPSRSMGYYLRVLRTFPEAFAWVQNRRWKGRNRLTTSEESPIQRFPSLANDADQFRLIMADRKNYAMIFFSNK